jgi:hypothetical protein
MAMAGVTIAVLIGLDDMQTLLWLSMVHWSGWPR